MTDELDGPRSPGVSSRQRDGVVSRVLEDGTFVVDLPDVGQTVEATPDVISPAGATARAGQPVRVTWAGGPDGSQVASVELREDLTTTPGA